MSHNNKSEKADEEKGLKDAIYLTASGLKMAFPHGTEVLSIGDLTIGLAFVAIDHQKKNVLQKINQYPKLHPTHLQRKPNHQQNDNHLNREFILHYDEDVQFEQIKRYNPENVSFRLLKKSSHDLFFADLAYEPDVYLQTKKTNIAASQSKISVHPLPHSTSLPLSSPPSSSSSSLMQYFRYSSETKVEKDIVPFFHYIHSVDVSKHLQTAHLVGLDLHQHRIIIAIRGTNSIHDIFTDFTANPIKWKVKRHYTLPVSLSSSLSSSHSSSSHSSSSHSSSSHSSSSSSSSHSSSSHSSSSLMQNEQTYSNENGLISKDVENLEDTDNMMMMMMNGYVHEGMYKSAQWVLECIRPVLIDTIIKFPTFANKIQLCGHSLGASIATILGICLREEFSSGKMQKQMMQRMESISETSYHKLSGENKNSPSSVSFFETLLPDIQVSAFAPSAILSQNISEWSSSFVTSFVIGGDIIPRFSGGQGEELRMEILATKWEQKFDQMKQDIYSKVLEYNEYFKSVSSFAEKYSLPVPQIVKQIGNKEDYHSVFSPFLSNEMNNNATLPQSLSQSLSSSSSSSSSSPSNSDNSVTTVNSTTKANIINDKNDLISNSSISNTSTSSMTNSKIDEQESKEFKMNREQKNKNVIFLYPPGDLYLLVEEEIEWPVSIQEEKHEDNKKNENSAFGRISSLIEMAADHLYGKYGHIGLENEAVESTSQNTIMANDDSDNENHKNDGNVTLERKRRASIMLREEKTDAKHNGKKMEKKNRIISHDKKYTIRHVSAQHFDRMIIHKKMLEDHKLVHIKDAFKFIIETEDTVNAQFQDTSHRYIPANLFPA